jgi:hypothetical protein
MAFTSAIEAKAMVVTLIELSTSFQAAIVSGPSRLAVASVSITVTFSMV